jgi:hypothetical protein
LKLRDRIRDASIVTAAASILITSGAVPAMAAYPTRDISLAYGNSTATGKATFYDRSVGIAGTIRVTSGNCRRVYGQTVDTDWNTLSWGDSGWKCNSTSTTQNYPMSINILANVRGGAYGVILQLQDDVIGEIDRQGLYR